MAQRVSCPTYPRSADQQRQVGALRYGRDPGGPVCSARRRDCSSYHECAAAYPADQSGARDLAYLELCAVGEKCRSLDLHYLLTQAGVHCVCGGPWGWTLSVQILSWPLVNPALTHPTPHPSK